jgi:hypothetical protein
MKDVKWTGPFPDCDFCPEGNVRGMINAPTVRDAGYGGKWANMCDPHFIQVGIDTSVTERRVRDEQAARPSRPSR